MFEIGPLVLTNDGLSITIIAVGIALFSTAIRAKVMDKEKMQKAKKKVKEKQKELKKASKSGDNKKTQKIQAELSKHMMDQMKESFKPMLFTIVPFLLVLGFLGSTYSDMNPVHEVVLVHKVPANVKEVKFSGNGTYIPEDNRIRWEVGTLHSTSSQRKIIPLMSKKLQKKVAFDINLTFNSLPKNFTVGEIKAQTAQNKSNQLDINYTESTIEENQISYRISCENNAVNNVVYFPLTFNFLIIHINNGLNWLGWYIICILIVSFPINKLAGLS